MIKRLRPKHTEKELQRLYSVPHDHRQWSDHLVRVGVTTQIAKWMVGEYSVESVADLSCGNGAIINSLPGNHYKGDFAPGYEYVGPIEETIWSIPQVDLFICSETLEHVDEPLEVLKSIRQQTKTLLLSTPEDNWNDSNPEHYWSWSAEGVRGLLEQAGFEIALYNRLQPVNYIYTYQIWGAK